MEFEDFDRQTVACDDITSDLRRFPENAPLFIEKGLMKQWESNAEKNHLSNAMRIVHTSLAARKNRQVFAWTEMLIRTRNQRG